MLPSITARTKLGPIYHRDARGTIRLRVAIWEDTATNCLDGKVQTTWHPRSLRIRYRRDP